MDVSDVKMSDEDDFLSRSTTIKPNNTIMKERFWINRMASEFVCHALHPDTSTPLNDERVVAVREDIDHDALWLALLNEVRQPGAHARSVR